MGLAKPWFQNVLPMIHGIRTVYIIRELKHYFHIIIRIVLMRIMSLGVCSLLLSVQISSAEVKTYNITDQSYDDVLFGLENAIIDEGLVISSHNHVGDMLARTAADVGADQAIFESADIFGFCSAELSRKAMEADPLNIKYCPYNIFMFQESGSDSVILGFDVYPEGPMQDVQSLLDAIARNAAGLDPL